MKREELKPNKILRGPLFAEPVEVLVTVPMGAAVKLVGRGIQTGKVVDIILAEEKLKLLETTPDTEPFGGDSKMFRPGIEAMRLGLAFEYDPYFSLSIAKVDPLPHQLEAVYDYFMRLPRIRFLLADDPGAGKTIMAGLLIKALKIRGLVKHSRRQGPPKAFRAHPSHRGRSRPPSHWKSLQRTRRRVPSQSSGENDPGHVGLDRAWSTPARRAGKECSLRPEDQP